MNIQLAENQLPTGEQEYRNTDNGQTAQQRLAEQLAALLAGKHGAEKKRERREIFLVDFLLLLLSKLKYVLLLVLLGGVVAGCYAKYLVQPMYAGTAKLCILSKESQNLAWSDFQGGFLLMEDCKEVFQNWEITEKVRSELNLQESPETMLERLTVYNPPRTQTLAITYTCESPKQAARIANTYARIGKNFIGEKMDVPKPADLSLAVIPGKAIGTGKTYYAVMGALFGGVLAASFFFFKYTLDDRPKTPEDIGEAADLNTLAVIPARKRKNRRRRSRIR